MSARVPLVAHGPEAQERTLDDDRGWRGYTGWRIDFVSCGRRVRPLPLLDENSGGPPGLNWRRSTERRTAEKSWGRPEVKRG